MDVWMIGLCGFVTILTPRRYIIILEWTSGTGRPGSVQSSSEEQESMPVYLTSYDSLAKIDGCYLIILLSSFGSGLLIEALV